MLRFAKTAMVMMAVLAWASACEGVRSVGDPWTDPADSGQELPVEIRDVTLDGDPDTTPGDTATDPQPGDVPPDLPPADEGIDLPVDPDSMVQDLAPENPGDPGDDAGSGDAIDVTPADDAPVSDEGDPGTTDDGDDALDPGLADPGTYDSELTDPGLVDNPPVDPGLADNPPVDPGLADNPPVDPGLVDNPPVDPGLADNPPTDPGVTDTADASEIVEPVACGNPPTAAASGTCITRPGSAWLLIQGHILVPRDSAPGGFLRNERLLIAPDGQIAAVGCNAVGGNAEAGGATQVLCRDVVVTPGLINGHDHITYTGNSPKGHGTERYDHRHEWRTGANGHTRIPVSSTSGQEAWGELRNVLAGTTTMFGSGLGKGLARNLDKDLLAGIDATRKATYDTFPLGDSDGTMLASGCAYPDLPSPVTSCWVPHIAEGINAAARNELLCMATASGGGVNALTPRNGIVHGIGVLASDIAAMSGRLESLIWSPRSNIDLYGNTAAVTVYARLGHNIGLGTDWTASGSMNILRELRCAERFNLTNLGAFFSDRDLLDMVTVNNAKAFRLEDKLGVIAPGNLGDVSLWNASVNEDERAVLDAAPQDILLVLRGGTPLYGDREIVKALTADDPGCRDDLEVCGAARRACVSRETGSSLASMAADAGYPLFFCEDPPTEPSCIPARTDEYDGLPKVGDLDGDGVPDGVDLCPTTFNPTRPLDTAGQADWDGDGAGDACDPCPMDAGTDACRLVRGDDLDGDGIADDDDLCPTQLDNGLDEDDDGKGDDCDPCPTLPNPGAESCPGTIYDVKTLAIGLGGTVRLKDVLVTAVGYSAGVAQGFVVQVAPADPAWNGSADHSGLYCYHPKGTPMPAAGDRVDVDGTVTEFHGQIELSKLTAVAVRSSNNAAPAPVVVLPADVATGGSRAAALEGVLVSVSDVEVLDINPPVVGSDKAPINEFVVTGNLRIDDFIHLATPFPALGDRFATISGVLRFGNDNSKIEPRGELDLVRLARVPELASFGPADVFALEGETGDTVPALTVRLKRTVDTDVTIQVSSTAPDRLDLPDGGAVLIPAGSLEATVPVIAKVADLVAVGLTAQLGEGPTLTADVRVVGPAETPALLAGEPRQLVVGVGDDDTWTLATDIPNYGATPLTIGLSLDPEGVATIPVSVDLAPRTLEAQVTVHGVAPGETMITATLGVSMLSLPTLVQALPTDGSMFISEYVEGGSNNKAIEIYNGTGTAVALDSCTLKLFSNGSATPNFTSTLAAAGLDPLAAGATYVLCNPAASAALAPRCQRLWEGINWNGDDAILLECGGAAVDVFGQVGFDPGTGWGESTAPTFTLDHSLRRKCGIVKGRADGSVAFDPAIEWDGFAKDTFDGLGAHTVACP